MLALFLVAGASLVACSGSADNPRDVLQDLNSQDLVLTIEDLPEGIEVSVTSELPITSNRAAFERFAADTLRRNEDLVGWGRTLGFRREFDNADRLDRAFDLFISSEAEVYRSEDGASQAFAVERQDHVVGSRLTQVSDLPSLGDESAAFRLSPKTRTEGEVQTDGYVLVWRRGPVLAFLRISITGGEIDRSLLVDLGEAADGLIANQLA